MKSIILNIGGQDRVFHFGLGFLGNLLETENIQMYEIDSKIKENPFKWIPLMMYYSCAYSYTRNNEAVTFNAYDIADWIDNETETIEVEVPFFNQETNAWGVKKEFSKKVVIDFFTAFNNSLIKNVPTDTDSKKKITKK
jgi:hypothetical protein